MYSAHYYTYESQGKYVRCLLVVTRYLIYLPFAEETYKNQISREPRARGWSNPQRAGVR